MNFSEILKHEVQGFSAEVQWLKKPMLVYGKNMPRNNQCTELIKNCPEKVKNYPEKKPAQN